MLSAFFRGATREERAASLPGDENIPDPVVVLDNGIDIAVPPETVWPRLARPTARPVQFTMQLRNIRNRAAAA